MIEGHDYARLLWICAERHIFDGLIREGFLDTIRSYLESDERKKEAFTGKAGCEIDDVTEILEDYTLADLKAFSDAIVYGEEIDIVRGGWKLRGVVFPEK